MRVLALLALLVLPAAGVAQPDPGAAYKSYHEAAVMGKLETARNFASASYAKQLFPRTAEERKQILEKMRANMPNFYGVQARTYSRDRGAVSLTLTGKIDMPYKQDVVGEVRVIKDLNGAWKVESVNWRSKTPAPAPAPAAGAPADKNAPPKKGAASPAGPTSTIVGPAKARPYVPPTPNRTLGQQKEPCVFKPAMTAEDLERCK